MRCPICSHWSSAGSSQPTATPCLFWMKPARSVRVPLLKLLELQARTGMTIKMLGDREQAQAIEAGDASRFCAASFRRRPCRNCSQPCGRRRGAAVRSQAYFATATAGQALNMKRADGHALMVGGDRDQVIARIADLYIARRDILIASGSKRGITVSAPTNDDAADISRAIRARLKARGEIEADETTLGAIDQRGQSLRPCPGSGRPGASLPPHWGTIDGRGPASRQQRRCRRGSWPERRGAEASARKTATLPTLNGAGCAKRRPSRLLLGFGHALTIDAAQGITSDEHINALPRGTAGVTAFTTYVAESRSRGTTWTVISEGALMEAERHRQALGDVTPITHERLWARAAEDMSEKPYKALGIDLLGQALRDREAAIDTFIECNQVMESASQADPDAGPKAFRRLRAAAVNDALGRHLNALDTAVAANTTLARDTAKGAEAAAHLAELRDRARVAADQLERAAATTERLRRSARPGA